MRHGQVGGFNHYWFDLNRDWMVAQLPESQARVKNSRNGGPTPLNHHEQNQRLLLFMPGEPYPGASYDP